MTIVETIPVTRAATRVDAEPVESASRQLDWRTRYPARAVGTDWPATCGDRAEVDRVVAAATAGLPTQRVREARRWGVPLLLDWLADQPGETWQQRWVAGGADAAGGDWAQHPEQWLRREGIYSENRLQLLTSSLLVVVGADVVRPSLAWLLTGGKKRKLVRNMVYGRDGAGFDRLRRLCGQDPAIRPDAVGDILFRSAVIVAAKGGMLEDITVGDVLEILDAEYAVRGRGIRRRRRSECSGRQGFSTRTRRRCSKSAVSANVRPSSWSTAIRSRVARSATCSSPTWPSGNRRSTTPRWSGWRITWCGASGSISSSIIPASTRYACRARWPARGNAGCAPRPSPSSATANVSRWSPNASATSTRWPRCRRSSSTWPNGDSTTPSGGVCGWHRARSARGSGPAQVRAPPRGPHGQPHPRTAACAARAGRSRRPVAARVAAVVAKPGNRPSRGSSSPPPERPSSGSTGRPRPRTTSGRAIPTPANHDCSIATRNMHSGRGRSSRCSATPASGWRNCSNSATTA